MSDYVLWRRLTQTDFNAMHGQASPYGRGGGAMHVALGVGNDKFPIAPFLQADRRKSITIQTVGETGRYGATSLNFSSNQRLPRSL